MVEVDFVTPAPSSPHWQGCFVDHFGFISTHRGRFAWLPKFTRIVDQSRVKIVDCIQAFKWFSMSIFS